MTEDRKCYIQSSKQEKTSSHFQSNKVEFWAVISQICYLFIYYVKLLSDLWLRWSRIVPRTARKLLTFLHLSSLDQQNKCQCMDRAVQ